MKVQIFKIVVSIIGVICILVLGCMHVMSKDDIWEWRESLGDISFIDSNVLKFEASLPSAYGYKDIRLNIPYTDEKQLNANIKLYLINKSDSNMHVVSHGYFVGQLTKNKKVIIFDNSLEELMKLYETGNAPRVANKFENEKIEIQISSNKKVSFPKPMKLYLYAADYP